MQRLQDSPKQPLGKGADNFIVSNVQGITYIKNELTSHNRFMNKLHNLLTTHNEVHARKMLEFNLKFN